VQLECKVLEVKATGEEGGAGNLVICEVVCMHINDAVLNEQLQIDPHKIDLVARMGGDFYCRASGNAVFEVAKPNLNLGVGVDQLPEAIRLSKVLTGNHLGVLGNCTSVPVIDEAYNDKHLNELLSRSYTNLEERINALHTYAKELLDTNKTDQAWQVLLK
jgi:hypothetical protein